MNGMIKIEQRKPIQMGKYKRWIKSKEYARLQVKARKLKAKEIVKDLSPFVVAPKDIFKKVV